MKTRKLWVGIGTFIMVGGAAGVTTTMAAGPSVSATTLMRAQSNDGAPRLPASPIILAQHHGGEAGENGGEAGVGDLPPDLAFAVRIALMRGHLLVGDELVQAKQWSAAMPHFLHPGEEIYADLGPTLDGYKVPQFDRALKALADVVKARKGGTDYTRTRNSVNSALALADAALKDKQSANWAGFEIEAAVELLKIAGSEYGNAIENNRITKPVEYQDARGFIAHAERMITAVSADLAKKDAESLKHVLASLAQLKKAFPKPMPPKAPVVSAPDLLSEIARIELAAGKLM